MKTLYVSDLDGTLLTSRTALSVDSVRILNELIRRGLPFTFATARSYSSASKLVSGLELSLPAITYNGAFMVDMHTGLPASTEMLNVERVREMRGIMNRAGILPLVYAFIAGEERVSYIVQPENRGMSDYIADRSGSRRMREVRSEPELYVGDIFYLTAIGALSQLEPSYAILRTRTDIIALLQEEKYLPGSYWLEIMPAAATKANAMLRLKQSLSAERLVCFGDYPNDLSMFAAADEAYAPCTAHPDVLACATEVIGSNDAEGVPRKLIELAVRDGIDVSGIIP